MSENSNSQPDITSQFQELGENIKSFFQSAWESEESQKFRQELQSGLNELGKATSEAVEDIKTSEAGQKLKTGADDFKTRVEAGEVEEKARAEVSKVLNFLNTELSKLNDQIKPTEDASPPAKETEI